MRLMPLYIPDIFGTVISAVSAVFAAQADSFNVHYDWGHQSDVITNLQAKDNSITLKDQKFPLIWLVTDFAEPPAKDSNVYTQVTLKVFIAVLTDPNYRMRDRRDKSFLPRLYPIYSELMNQLSLSAAFGMPQFGVSNAPTKIDRPYWGKQDANGNNQVNMLNNYCDAIELQNLKLNVARQIC